MTRFEGFAKEYLEYVKVYKHSWTRDETGLKWLISCLKDFRLSKITLFHIEGYKEARFEKVKPSTINRELMTYSHIFSIAEKFRKFDGKSPVKEAKFFQEQQFVMKILNKEEIRRLIEVSSGYLRAIIVLALNTGMRKGKIFNQRWNDMDFSELYIYTKKSKSNRTRKIPMNGVVLAALKSIKREGEFLFMSRKSGGCFTQVFHSFKTACRKAGVSDLRFHDLGYSAAALLVMGGANLVMVKEILGHSRIDMTMRYAHPTPEKGVKNSHKSAIRAIS